ncbi:MAG: hypothetical protein HY299_11670 [Verrucomicrobia bacterium]|nr:hypothetical protein [Verrucomicrobiota bacterium]
MNDPNPPPPEAASRKAKPPSSDAEFAQKYFTLLLGQYKMMGQRANDAAALAEAERIARISVAQITWEDIYGFELSILKLEPLESLRRKAWILREEYQEIASSKEQKDYADSNPPDASLASVKEADLRADLVKLQEELNWAYTVLWVQEEFRSKLTRAVVGMTLACVLIFGVFILFLGGFTPRLTLPAVAFAGMIGGCINTVRRIQKTDLQGNSDLNLIQLERGKLSVYVSPFLGAIFAVVLYAIFASGYIKSGLFPDYTSAPADLLYGLFPILSGTELAKLLVWSFIAGFAEQFVPDRLDQLTKRGGEEGDMNPSGAPRPPDMERIRKMMEEIKLPGAPS